MLARRYQHDGISLLRLNDLQTTMKAQVDAKVADSTYQFEHVPCCICAGSEFVTLASKDRYGLHMPVVACQNCGLIQTNPRMNQEAYNEFYNEEYRKLYSGESQASDDFFRKQNRTGKKIFEYLRATKTLPGAPSDLLVLEIGCGAGGVLHYFQSMGCLTVGIDLAAEYVAFGKSKYGLDLAVCTLRDLVVERPPDVILYSHVLEHILDPNEELRAVSRILSERGILYVCLPGVKNLHRSYQTDFLRLLQNAHTYHFTLDTLKNLMARNGFEMVAGNETIDSVFRKRPPTAPEPEPTNDYSDVVRYLNRVERLRVWRSGWVPAKKAVKSALKTVLRLIGMERTAKRIYRRIRE